MHATRVLFLLLLFAFCSEAYSAVFVVTSKADSGPGTLREALTLAAANGSAVKDYINFNLPGNTQQAITIILSSALPYVSSNLVIDGTTQPGSKLARSDAKVILQPDNPGVAFNGLVLLDAIGVEIYGLYVRDFISNAQSVPYYSGAIYIETSSNVQIGAPGKGNVFAGDGFAESCFGPSLKDRTSPVVFSVNNLKFYSNIVGFEPDGKTYRGTNVWYNGGGLVLNYCKGDIRIGDNDVATKNIFGNGAAILNSANGTTLYQSSILIKNNYFSYDIDGNPSAIVNINGVAISSILIAQYSPLENLDYPYNVSIINNKFQYPCSISCGHISGDFTMQGNKLLFEPSVIHPASDIGIGATSDGSILIGGINPGEGNTLYGEEIDLFSRKSVLIQRNSIYCVPDFRGIWFPSVPYLDPPLPLPTVMIINITGQSVSGTATPLSKVELFWDDDCVYCEPLTYVATVNADINGNWHYNGIVQKGVIASATLKGFTSVFTKHAVYVGGNTINSSCGIEGSITGTVFQNTGGYQWKNAQGEVIGTNSEIKNLYPGTYTLSALNGTCSKVYDFTILDATPKIDESNKTVIQPSCNQSTGSITGLYLGNFDVLEQAYSSGNYNVYTYKWIDAGGSIKGTSIDLTNVEVGTYHLEISYLSQCTSTYGPVTFKNVSGPNIDQSKVAIQPTNCGQSTGSVSNLVITGTGTLKYSWFNDQQQQVSASLNLTHQPAGTYKLQVTDDTQCGPIFSSDFKIPELNGITLDESNVQTTIASCSINNGSVTGIKIEGATQYQWLDANKKAMATTPDLQNVAAGDYTLTASNSDGCTEVSKPYHIGQQLPTKFPVYTDVIISSCFGDKSGAISITTDALVKSLRWQNSEGQTISTAANLTGVATGVYQLYLTDQNGCESLYENFTVPELDRFILAQAGQVSNDQCGLKTGSVTTTTVSGGLPPYTYKWVDAGGAQVGSGSEITNLTEGIYTLNIADAKCGNIDISYTIKEQTEDVTAPSVNNAELCSSGTAVLTVNNSPKSSTYRLYDSETSTKPLVEQTGGSFTVSVNNSRSYFISQLLGTCESSRSEVKVTVGISALSIINAFTPNGDGINDYWKIIGIENYPDATVRVFDRYGQKEFDSKGYAVPFDGKYGGKLLPPGVYYYIINLSNSCNMLSGNLTIIR